VGTEGIINNIVFYGDFFGNAEPALLTEILTDRHFERVEVADVMRNVDISAFFFFFFMDTFLSMLFE
jgi:hypothetical protein